VEAVNRFDAADSIFAPIVAAVPPGTQWAGFGNALSAAGAGVPRAGILYKVKRSGSFRRAEEIRERTVMVVSGDGAKPFSAKDTLMDRPTGTATVTGAATIWQLGMSHLKDGLCAPAVPEDYDSAILQTSTFRLTNAGMSGAPQLALVRHRWAASVLAASPNAVVFGAQRHWRDEWWTVQITYAERV
jgi:hypothetical protein